MMYTHKPLILVGNHSSYLDIIILGSILPACFVAKSEIRGWFFFGFLAKLQSSIFIDRRNLRTLESLKKEYDITVYDIMYFGDHFLPKNNPNLKINGNSHDDVSYLPITSP